MNEKKSVQLFTTNFVQNQYNLSPIDFDIAFVMAMHLDCPLATPDMQSHTWGPVIRDYSKIVYITHGHGILTVNGVDHHLHGGQLFVNFPGCVTTEYTERPDPWGYYDMYIKSNCVPQYLRSLGFSELSPAFPKENMTELIPIFEEAIAAQGAQTPDYILRQTMCLCKLLSVLTQHATFVTQEKRMNANDYIERALQFFEMHYPEKITIVDVAESLGLDRSHFSRLFKLHMDISPQEYLIRLRIRKACDFLLVPGATVNSVANSVGYDPFAFSRVFKQVIGISPSEFQSHTGIRASDHKK